MSRIGSDSRKHWISETYPTVEVNMVIEIFFTEPEYHSVEINIPQGLPEDLIDTLWLKGICEGVHAAIRDVQYDFYQHDLDVHIKGLDITVPLENLNLSEIDYLRNVLMSVAREIVVDLLA